MANPTFPPPPPGPASPLPAPPASVPGEGATRGAHGGKTGEGSLTGLGETRSTFIDWVATNNPRLGGLCPGEIAIAVLLAFTVLVFLTAQYFARVDVFVFLTDFSFPIAAFATAWAALEVWRNLRQIERTDEGSLTPHLWLLGVQQTRLLTPGHAPSSVTGLHELFLHNYGPGLAVDVRVVIDGRPIDRIPFLAPGSSSQVGGALHGHGMEGTHAFEVVYRASSGREHRLGGTLLRDRDMDEILFRSDQFNHIYSVA